MINSNFTVGFKIDRQNLYQIVKNNYKNLRCEYDPDRHAAVRIYYSNQTINNVAIFVFESGAIVITGAINKEGIVESFNYIIRILYDNFRQIVKIDINKFFERKDIVMLINSQ